jgi:hypothetical protein
VLSKELFRELIQSISDVVSVQNKVVCPVLFHKNSKKKGLLKSHRIEIVSSSTGEESHRLGRLKVLQDSLSVNKLLGHESSGGKHGKTAVLKFLGLDDLQLLGVGRLQAKRVETDVTRGVVGTEKTGLVDRDVLGFDPANGGTGLLSSTNGDGEGDPETNRDLSEVADGGSSDFCIKEEGRSLNLLSDEETESGKHGDTSVGQLSLTVTLHGVFISLLGESERIEESNRGEGTWKILSGEGVEGGGLRVGGGRGKGCGRADDGEKGGGQLHFFS